MNTETRDHLNRLVTCLEGALAVLDEEVRTAEAQEEDRKASQARLPQMRDELLARPSPLTAPEEWLKPLPGQEGDLRSRVMGTLGAAQNRSTRWEAAFAEAGDCLMRLWAEPELRSTAEGIAEAIRTARMMRAGGPDPGWRSQRRERLQKEQELLQARAPKVISLPPDATEEDVAPLMREIMGQAFDFMADMSVGLAQAHQATMEWFAARREPLARALAAARELRDWPRQ
jgi:hypothetical protein